MLKDENDRVLATTVTDRMGVYKFNHLPAGNYTVTEISLGEVPLDVDDFDGGDQNFDSVTLGVGKISTGIDFLDERCRMIMGKVTQYTNNKSNGGMPILQVVRLTISTPLTS